MVELLKKIIPNELKEVFKDLSGHNFIRNYYKTNFKKKVLVSYLNKPFVSKTSHVHTNLHEAVATAEAFHSLNYSVDLVNYTKSRNYDISSYDVVYGLGEAVEYALKNRQKRSKNPFVIWHGTGASPFYSNPTTITRLKSSFDESGMLFYDSTRFIEKMYPLSYVFSDLIILYGNEFTKETYSHHTYSPIELISPTSYFTHEPKPKIKPSDKNYFWFGSAGAIHKGLDIVLQFFFNHPELDLHICGDVKRENAFYEFYKLKISESANIHYYGFVDIASARFKQLMDIGAFSIFPSCSEGIATSVLTTMSNGGMIPIVTRNTGISIRDYGILIEEISPMGVEKAIAESQKLSLEEINRRSENIVAYAKQNYTIENFSKNLKKILNKHI